MSSVLKLGFQGDILVQCHRAGDAWWTDFLWRPLRLGSPRPLLPSPSCFQRCPRIMGPSGPAPGPSHTGIPLLL